MEIWKDIKGYEGKYQVSNKGNVRNNTKVLHLNTNTYGYKHISLCKCGVSKTCPVHTLVAQAFICNPLNATQINHKDGNKENNNVDNLEWVSQQENNIHAIKTGLRKTKTIEMMDECGCIIKTFKNRMEIEEFLGKRVYQDTITRCCNNQRKTAYGYYWRYKE